MCGIWGFKFTPSYFDKLMEANVRRGGYSIGFITFGKERVIVKDWQKNWEKYRDVIRQNVPAFGQFRAPTTDIGEEFVYSENYPLEYDNVYLFGNGVINAEYYRKLKKKFGGSNNNDLYYVGLEIIEEGFDILNDIEGVFALAMIKVDDKGQIENVYLMRNTYPLFINDNVYSSAKVSNNMRMLENGIVYDWWNGEVVVRFKPKEIPFLVM